METFQTKKKVKERWEIIVFGKRKMKFFELYYKITFVMEDGTQHFICLSIKSREQKRHF